MNEPKYQLGGICSSPINRRGNEVLNQKSTGDGHEKYLGNKMGRMLTRANNYIAQTMYQAVLSALQVFLFNPHNYPMR